MKEGLGALVVVVVAIAYMALIFIVPKVIEEAATRKRRKQVGGIIASIFPKTPLSRKQIEILCKDQRLTTQDSQILLRNQFTEAVKDGNETLIKYFQDLYEQLEKDEPFEGLPSDVRLHLERIKESIGPGKELLMEPLASQLQDITVAHKRKEKLMWWLTVASFILGVLGVVFGALPFFPSTNKSVTTPAPTAPQSAVTSHESPGQVMPSSPPASGR